MTSQPPREVPAIELRGVVKDYRGLRPLRIAALKVDPGERVAIAGIDAAGAEILVNLINGASTPDQGEIRVNGRATADIADADDWLASLEQFGIVTPRAVLLEGSTVRQNLAIPFTLGIDDLPDEVRARVTSLALEAGIASEVLETAIGDAGGTVRMRAHLAKSLALGPRLLLFEHPTLGIEASDAPALAADIVRVCTSRRLTALVISNDQAFIRAVATRVLTLQPATGELTEPRWWQRWFGM